MGKKRIVTKGGEDTSQIAEKITAVSQKGLAHKTLEKGRVYIRASYNNTQLIFTDESGIETGHNCLF